MKIYSTPARTLATSDDKRRRRVNMQKAQSGAVAEARAQAAHDKAIFALTAADLTEQERQWHLNDANKDARRAERQLSCAKSHNFVVSEVAPGVTEARTVYNRRCNQRTCLLCAVKRSRKLHTQLVDAYFRALERVPGAVAVDLTLTQHSVPMHDLGAAIDKMHKGIAKLFRTPLFQGATLGRFRNTECNFNQATQKWHVHSHNCLICVPGYGPKHPHYLKYDTKLMPLWALTMGMGDFVSLNIQQIKDQRTGNTDPQSVARALWHTAKYVTKPASIFNAIDPNTLIYEISPELAAAHQQGMHGRRMSEFAGVMKRSWKPTKATSAKHRRPRKRPPASPPIRALNPSAKEQTQ